MDEIMIHIAGHAEQGQLGPLLIDCYGVALQEEMAAAQAAGFHTASVEDELMAADDFYFSTLDLMNCCFFAKEGETIIGASCINPYTAELQYLAVRPTHRRRGVGALLLKAALGELKRRGVAHVKIDLPAHESLAAGASFLATQGFASVRTVTRFGCKLMDVPQPSQEDLPENEE